METYEMRTAIRAAEETLRAADKVAETLAVCLHGRLRKVDNKYILTAMKKELQNYNAVTGKWRD